MCKFLFIPIDQAHEQNNEMVVHGVVGLTENPVAFRRWNTFTGCDTSVKGKNLHGKPMYQKLLKQFCILQSIHSS